MAAPTVQSITGTGFASASTTHLCNYPATVDAGDLLIILFSVYGVDSPSFTTPPGYTQLYVSSAADFVRAGAWAKSASGSEDGGTEDVATSLAKAGAGQIYRITGWSGTIGDIAVGTTAESASTTPDPPNVSPGSTADWLYIAAIHTGDDDIAINGWAANYSSGDGADTACGAGADASGRIASYWRQTTATSSENPATFSLVSSETWHCNTIAIKPSAATGTTILVPTGPWR